MGGGGNAALSLRYVGKPQDGRADAIVDLCIAPSYVTYNRAAIQRIADFFKAQDSAEFSRLTAQVSLGAERFGGVGIAHDGWRFICEVLNRYD